MNENKHHGVGLLAGRGLQIGAWGGLGLLMLMGMTGVECVLGAGEKPPMPPSAAPVRGNATRSLNLGGAPDFGGGLSGSNAGRLSPPGSGKGTEGLRSKEDKAEVRRATEITSQGGLSYDPTESKAVFSGSVQVLHPVFDLSCEKLTAYLNRSKTQQGLGAGAVGGRESSQTAGGLAQASGSRAEEKTEGKGFGAPSALQQAVAEGKVVITQEKRNEKGELERSVGRAQQVVYDSSTADITLTGWPRVEQKQNLIVALEESTVMVLNKSGRVNVIGKSKTVLRDSKIEE